MFCLSGNAKSGSRDERSDIRDSSCSGPGYRFRSPGIRTVTAELGTQTQGVKPMIEARCSCGAVAVSLPGPTDRVAACHCIACQRRTGAPFGVGAFYPVQAVEIRGAPKEYVRAADSGGKVRSYFCTECGSTVYWKADNLSAMIGVALGAIA